MSAKTISTISTKRRSRGRLAVAAVGLAAAAALTLTVFATGHAFAAGTAPAAGRLAVPGTRNWIATGWNIHLLGQASPATATHFFNTPGSYGTSSAPASNPVMDGVATSPVLLYFSYAQFASDVQSGAITAPYRWVSYDPEPWSQTPLSEQQDPRTYLRQFGQLAHAHGYRVIEAPGRDLGLVTGSICPKPSNQSLDRWYVACNIAGMAAPYSDLYVLQNQVNTTNLTEYAWLFNNVKQQALAANPRIMVDSELSTGYGTPTEMAAAAKSVAADGFYLSITSSAISQITQFFQKMQTAGY
jgi:hypothetical protein